jgi:hypothetical protein
MKTDAEKIKEWDLLDDWFRAMNEQFKYSGGDKSENDEYYIPEDGELRERARRLYINAGPAARSKGMRDCMGFIKHTKPFIEFLKVEHPSLLEGSGIDFMSELNAVGKYFKANNIEVPKGHNIGAFFELFCRLLRECNLMKEEEFSSQSSWDVLVK